MNLWYTLLLKIWYTQLMNL
jgi:hypothetical protein